MDKIEHLYVGLSFPLLFFLNLFILRERERVHVQVLMLGTGEGQRERERENPMQGFSLWAPSHDVNSDIMT